MFKYFTFCLHERLTPIEMSIPLEDICVTRKWQPLILRKSAQAPVEEAHTHTHTYIYIYILLKTNNYYFQVGHNIF